MAPLHYPSFSFVLHFGDVIYSKDLILKLLLTKEEINSYILTLKYLTLRSTRLRCSSFLRCSRVSVNTYLPTVLWPQSRVNFLLREIAISDKVAHL